MKTSIKKYMVVALASCFIPTAMAQELRTSYFQQTATFRHQMNPALLNRPHIGILFGNVNIGVTGNMGYKDLVHDLKDNTQYKRTTFMHPNIDESTALKAFDKNNRADVYLNYNLFSVAFKGFGGVNLIEANVRSDNHIKLPYDLFELAKSTGVRQQYNLKNIGVRSQNYMEVALGHSRNINKQLRVGGKVKVLIGAGYADLSADEMTLTLQNDQWKVDADAKLNVAIPGGTFTNKTNKPTQNGRPRVDELKLDFSPQLAGFGMAVDMGAVYKLNNSWTFSGALTDVGFISWKNVQRGSSSGSYTFKGFEDIYVKNTSNKNNDLGKQFEAIGNDLEELFDLYNDGSGKQNAFLAATLNLGAEYTLPSYKRLRLGYLFSQRMGKYGYHTSMVSANWRPINFIETTLSSALTSTGLTTGALISFHCTGFNLFVGCDAFMGKVTREYIPLNNSNANISFGMNFPLAL